MELNREQIIKALEHCASGTSSEACDGCPFNDMQLCDQESNAIEKHALALIKELTVEVEALRGAANSYKMHYENVKSDTIRKMQLRFKDELSKSEGRLHFTFELCEMINQIAKKMLEENE